MKNARTQESRNSRKGNYLVILITGWKAVAVLTFQMARRPEGLKQGPLYIGQWCMVDAIFLLGEMCKSLFCED
jgi:hypothetical protein